MRPGLHLQQEISKCTWLMLLTTLMWSGSHLQQIEQVQDKFYWLMLLWMNILDKCNQSRVCQLLSVWYHYVNLCFTKNMLSIIFCHQNKVPTSFGEVCRNILNLAHHSSWKHIGDWQYCQWGLHMCTHPSFQAYETLKQIQNSFNPLTLAKIQAMTVLPPSQWFLDNLYQLKGGRTCKT